MLLPYQLDKPVIIECVASEGCGVILLQPDKEQRERPVAYASRKFKEAEKNYAPIDKEALATIYAVNKLRQYIHGRRFVLRADHKPLERLFTWKRFTKNDKC